MVGKGKVRYNFVMKKAAKEKEQKEIKNGKNKNENKNKNKKLGVIVGIVSVVMIVVGGGWMGVRMFARRELVETNELVTVPGGPGFSNVFKEYIDGRLMATELFGTKFRTLESEETLEELAEIKDIFSDISREVAEYNGTGFKGVTEIMRNDATVYLKEIRELRQILTGTETDADKQAKFMKVVQESEEALRSAIYLAEEAFPEGKSRLGGVGVIIFQGEMMVEVGGGVMNVFVGNETDKVVAVSTDDYAENVKTIRSEEGFGFLDEEVIRIGSGVKDEMVDGKLKVIESKDGKIEKRLISLLGESTWSLAPKLEERGIVGLTSKKE